MTDVPAIVGTPIGPFTVEVERGRLRAFAAAIGETDPIHLDVEAARAAGHPDLLAPPTFLFGLDLETGAVWSMIDSLGIDRTTVLHGEQDFTYHQHVHAGDTLVLRTEVTGITLKRGGALQVIERSTRVTLQDSTPAAELRSVILARTPTEAPS